jgi:uncharacterized protein (TIGR03435 family)
MKTLLVIALVLTASLFGQSPTFSSASMKRMPPETAFGSGKFGWVDSKITFESAPMLTILVTAYQTPYYLIQDGNGKPWNEPKNPKGHYWFYSIEGQMPAGSSAGFQMLQELLKDRLGLRAHWEDRETPSYVFTTAPRNIQFLDGATPADESFTIAMKPISPTESRAETPPITMGVFVRHVSMMTGGTQVIDQTSLGNKVFKLSWNVKRIGSGGKGYQDSLLNSLFDLGAVRENIRRKTLIIDNVNRDLKGN